MTTTAAYAAASEKDQLKPFQIKRREPGVHDVEIDIHFCGVCHSDIHQVRNEWGGAKFPMVPGHEIAGKVSHVGSAVTKFKVGDSVGVGCFVDSCRTCDMCQADLQQYCPNQICFTYNSYEKDGKTPTFGGYSTKIVVAEDYVLRIPDSLPLDKAAPLLCAGITTYSPLRHWDIKPGDKVAIVGLGGLGHMAVKLAAAMGAEVTVLSTSENKKADALRLGATHFINTTDPSVFTTYINSFDFMISTAAGNIQIDNYLNLLKYDSTLVVVGIPAQPYQLGASPLIGNRRHVAGSLIGGIKETQEMLDFCAVHNIVSDIELIPIEKINEAYDRTIKGDVKYRFVIDISSLKNA
ncbi:MAG: NAD(P)-dependent alcohol dehydrogenase [Gammaproteobacteria bacterium]|nr:NAD(P)-dependent alcohol dehydrogenase [Gammaproteobacteria bacterium]